MYHNLNKNILNFLTVLLLVFGNVSEVFVVCW
jgi:hypothetical protein